jgi:glycosyltransferase involved in cell wall biosynthesis
MGTQPPFFSIIVPSYNRPRDLTACLQSLARLDYSRDHFEVIVVDDGGQELLEQVTAPFRQQIDVTLLPQRHSGPAVARNNGARRAKGKLLAFTDDDCRPAVSWLKKLAARIGMTPDHAIGGRTLNALPRNPYSTASQLLIDYLYGYYNADPERASFLTSNNVAFPAEGFWAIGGFDATWDRAAAEDRELCDRWLHYGYRMSYTPEAIVYHAHSLSLTSFCRQHFNYGRGAFRFHQVRAYRGHNRIRVEPVSFYRRLLRYPFTYEQNKKPFLLAVLIALAQVANAAGFFYQKALNAERAKRTSVKSRKRLEHEPS